MTSSYASAAVEALLASPRSNTAAPEEIDFVAIKELMTARHTVSLVDRHVAAIRKVCKTCCNGFLLKHLQHLVELLQLTIQRFSEGLIEFAPAICDFTRVASQPLVSCRASDMITYGHHLPAFIKVLVSVLQYSLPPEEEAPSGGDQAEALRIFEERRALFERIRIEVAHTLACWSRFGLDEDSVEPQPDQPLIQAVADAGTPNLRILRHSQVIDALSASFRNEDSPEAIVITLGAIRDMSLYRPLSKQITNCGLISNLVHVVRVNLLGSDVLLVAAEVLWNVLELDFDGAAEALGQADIIEAFVVVAPVPAPPFCARSRSCSCSSCRRSPSPSSKLLNGSARKRALSTRIVPSPWHQPHSQPRTALSVQHWPPFQLYQPGTYPYPYAGHLLITMPILGIPLFFEGASLRLSSPFGVSILGIGISSRLVTAGSAGPTSALAISPARRGD
ncbi:unnamed protein product [Prorocentrum cordatum]|uniref:Cilia- and flagella-associated protein 69 ARM repeats domain-containing protein n=1 Tax=Prorocentrum cordatum TaxID=2364126 RepID=A0ABN9WGE0_9DINO|nr:unnamed protein product [Polarella glacialis]